MCDDRRRSIAALGVLCVLTACQPETFDQSLVTVTDSAGVEIVLIETDDLDIEYVTVYGWLEGG